MNNRYLYRAKRCDTGEWVEGFYFCMEHTDCRHTHHFIMPLGTELSLGTPIEKIQVEVDPSTICQCTGLKDKNGKLIWENDILMCHGNKKDLCKVCFGEFKVLYIENMVDVDIVQGWYYEPLETDELSKCEPFCHEMPLTNYYLELMDADVIGNIFDNQELLEAGE